MVMSPGQMLLTHFIVVVVCIGQMLLCQSILFFYLLVHDVKEPCGHEGVTSLDFIRLCLLFPLPPVTGPIPTLNLYSN